MSKGWWTRTMAQILPTPKDKNMRRGLRNLEHATVGYKMPDILPGIFSDDELVCYLLDNPHKIYNLPEAMKMHLLLNLPALEAVITPLLSISGKLVLSKLRPWPYLTYINVDKLTSNQLSFLIEDETCRTTILSRPANKEKILKSVRTYWAWNSVLRTQPRMAKYFNVRNIRNPTELRNILVKRPALIKYSTLDDIKASAMPTHTWARTITEIKPRYRKHFPAGTKEWIEKSIFVSQLKSRKFKSFGDWQTNLP